MTDDLQNAQRRQAQQLADLAKLPPVSITGLIFPNGAGASHTPGDAMWILGFTCAAWSLGNGRQGAGQVHRQPLRVRQWVSEAGVRPLMERLKAGTIVRFRARPGETNWGETGDERSEALLDEIEAVDVNDADLLAVLDELRKPVTHHDDVFGILTLDRRVNWYECDATWGGRTVRFSATVSKAGDLERSLAVGRRMWADQAEWARRAHKLVVAELLALKNSSWLDEGEAPVSANDFGERMTLESICVGPDGEVELSYSDGELFWGHGIQVYGTIEDGPQRAEIAG